MHTRSIACFLTITGTAVLALALVWIFSGEHPLPIVVGAAHNPTSPNSTPYAGPHPARLPRAADPFVYPIEAGEVGPVKPLFGGPPEYPFLCQSEESGLGQPLVDNQKGLGIPIYAETDSGEKTERPIGYSKDCLLPTRVRYYYNRAGTKRFYPLEDTRYDVGKIDIDGHDIDFIVRVETGTINRFIYAIAVVGAPDGDPEHSGARYWNGRLIYQFGGGVGIGRRQGKITPEQLLEDEFDQLANGYAVAFSSGTRTSTHYDIWLSEDTVRRVKEQFTARYGEPVYTVGVGGSGGAIEQYLLGQNRPGLLDAAIALYSYPDMVTQTIHVFDCELIEYYFDVTDADNPRWRDWSKRSLIEGFNADDDTFNWQSLIIGLSRLAQGKPPVWPFGNSECVKSWRGLTPLVHNPRYAYFTDRVAPEIAARTDWSYWEDLAYIFGRGDDGYARSTWDNVGVQYGLAALVAGKITPEEFLRLNATIGGWKPRREMQPERYWYVPGARSSLARLSPWSRQNMRTSEAGETAAPRTQGDLAAVEAAYRSGQVFLGYVDMPVIDLRHYLDPELNMHHSSASFSARIRMQRAQGHADNQLIWVTRRPHAPIGEAFDLIDRWMHNIREHPTRGVVANKPLDAKDRCFTADGSVVAEGEGVWDGAWNGRPTGDCMKTYPIFGTSRTVAGADLAGDTFLCALQPIEAAITRGVYGNVDMRPYVERLKAIFPHGVCDYTRPDRGRPQDLFEAASSKIPPAGR